MRMTIAAVLILLSGGFALAEIGGGDVTLKNEGGNVIFSHDSHVKEVGLGCQECHPKLFLNTRKHAAVTMKEMESGKSCGACHNGKKTFAVTENCETCHSKEQAK